MQLWHSPFFDGGVENCPSSVGLYRVFNPLALWALPLYRCTTQGERIEKRSFSLCCFCAPPCCGARQGEEGCQSPPLCFAKQNIGEVSRSDGGVEKTRLCLFILLNSEKNEPRSSAAVIGLFGSSPRLPSGTAELAPLGQSSPFFLRLPCVFTAR